MAITPTLKLTDLFNQITNPGGGFAMPKSAPYVAPSAPLRAPVQASAAPAPSGLNAFIAGNNAKMPGFNPAFAPGQVAPSKAPIFTPSSAGPSAAPVGPTGATGAAPVSQVPSQYLNKDGSIKTPDQVAADVGASLRGAHGGADVGRLSLEQFGDQSGKSAADLAVEAQRIGNTRNDIAAGETDPYKVASKSGIAYTPAELSAIEKAYAGEYDPALDTALQKVKDKQTSDAAVAEASAKNAAPFTLGKDEVRYDADGNPIAVGLSSNGGSGGTYTKGQNPIVDAYVSGFGTLYKASDIPDEYKDLVAQGVAASTGSGAKLSKTSTDAISIINELQGLDLSKLSGTGFVGGVEHPSSLFPGTSVQNTQNLAKQLQATLSLANRSQLKGSGAISDFEFRVLGDAASALGLNDAGRTNLNPDDFKSQLKKLELKLQVGPTSLTDDEMQHLSDQGYSVDDIRALSDDPSFSSAGNASASTQVSVAPGSGNRPQRNNNPGDVKAGGLADDLAIGQDDEGHLIFPDAKTGFQALTADLTAKVNGQSSKLPANPTIAELGKVYAEDPNWPKKVAAILGVPVDTHTQAVPLANLVKAVATQEGFYA